MNEINRPNYSPPPDFTPPNETLRVAPAPLPPPRQSVFHTIARIVLEAFTVQKVARTIGEAFALFVGMVFLVGVLHALGASFLMPSQDQSQGVEKLIATSPAKLFVAAVILAPLTEELIFRGIPMLLMRVSTKAETRTRFVFWVVFGLASAVIFAAMHGLKQIGTPPNARMVFQTLPLPQLLLGLWLWRVATQRGLQYSILLHAIFNLITFTLALQAVRFVKP